MADDLRRRGAVDPGVPLMILAFVVIGAFLWWLQAQSAAERALDVAVDTVTETSDPAGAPTIAATELQLDASPYEGQMVHLAGLTVASRLGQQGFWLELPNRNPFLVSLTPEVVAEGVSPGSGQTVNVTGTILAMNDSIITAWTTAGTIGEGDRLAAEFATHFMEARRVEVAAGPADTTRAN